jgi:acyl-CoA reductase-like NAD-dependent aldehyde dehydrogenase
LGYFVQPTIFANVDRNATIAREEIFGPVLVANRYDDLDEVIKIANDTPYGLGSGVFTRDLSKAHRIAKRLRAGNVWINCYGVMDPSMPFGGFKESGWGRELGSAGVDAFRENFGAESFGSRIKQLVWRTFNSPGWRLGQLALVEFDLRKHCFVRFYRRGTYG